MEHTPQMMSSGLGSREPGCLPTTPLRSLMEAVTLIALSAPGAREKAPKRCRCYEAGLMSRPGYPSTYSTPGAQALEGCLAHGRGVHQRWHALALLNQFHR